VTELPQTAATHTYNNLSSSQLYVEGLIVFMQASCIENRAKAQPQPNVWWN